LEIKDWMSIYGKNEYILTAQEHSGILKWGREKVAEDITAAMRLALAYG
jgi:hypothetical protein